MSRYNDMTDLLYALIASPSLDDDTKEKLKAILTRGC